MQPMTETMMLNGADAADGGCEGAMVMVMTAMMAMTAMTTTMTMKMHPFYPKPTNAQLIAYKPFFRTVGADSAVGVGATGGASCAPYLSLIHI